MKFRIILSVLILLTMLNTGIGCSCSGGGRGDFIELMKMVPKDSTSFTFWNVEALGESEDTYPIWEDWQGKIDDWLNDIGEVETYEVKVFSQALIPDMGVVTIITGDFIVDEIEVYLEENGYTSNPYKEISVFTKMEGDTEVAISFYKGIIIGNKEIVEKCIDVIKGEDGNPSLYNETSIKEIADRLPGGVMTCITKNEELYKNLLGIGMSLQKNNEATLKVKAFYKFKVAGAAKDEDTISDIKNDLAAMDLPAIKCVCFDTNADSNGEFIEAQAMMYINDFSFFNLA